MSIRHKVATKASATSQSIMAGIGGFNSHTHRCDINGEQLMSSFGLHKLCAH